VYIYQDNQNGLYVRVNLFPKFHIWLGIFILVSLVEEKLRMTAHLKFILPSREQLIGMGLDIHVVKRCLPPIQRNDLVLDCLGTQVSSSNSLEECQEEYPISFYYFKGILHWEDVGTLSIWKCPLTEIQLHTPILIGWFSTLFAEFNKVT
jgi:hypothetical protein